MHNQILALGVLMTTYALIILKPVKMNEAHAALIGAALTIVFLLEPHHVLESLGIPTPEKPNPLVATWNVVIILATLMVISTTLDDYGFFEYCATRAVRASGNSGPKLFKYTYLVVSLISTFTGNDVVILTTTPIILIFCRSAGIPPRPYMYASFFAANTFSMPLYIGNLTNILIGDSFKLDYFGFTGIMLVPTLAAATLNYYILKHIFRLEIPSSFIVKNNNDGVIKNRKLVIIGIIVLGGVIIFGGIADFIEIPLSFVTLIGAGMLMLIERRPIQRIKRIYWNVVLFVIGLFIVVKSLEVTGLSEIVGSYLLSHLGGNILLTTLSLSLFSAYLCNLMNNIPMTAMMLSILKQASLSLDMSNAFAYSLVIGSNLGANFTTFGALAGVLWLESARRYGWSTSLVEFLRIGFFVTPIAILGSSIALALLIMVF